MPKQADHARGKENMKKIFIVGLFIKALSCPLLDALGQAQALAGYSGQEIYIDHTDHGHVVYK